MKLAHRLTCWISCQLIGRIAARRDPDFVVSDPSGTVYLNRWWVLPRNPACNVYLHEFCNNDDARALHDHPWGSVSLVLRGVYVEVLPVTQGQAPGWDYLPSGLRYVPRFPGEMIWRRARHRHRIEVGMGRAYTLFITGPVLREWGFHCRAGWVPWKNFVNVSDKGLTGAGCEGAMRSPRRWWQVFRGDHA